MKPAPFLQNIKQVFDLLQAVSAYVSIAGIGILIIGYARDNGSYMQVFFQEHPVFAYIISAVIFTGPVAFLAGAPLIRRMSLYLLRRKRFSNILIEKQEVLIDVSGDGSAAFYEKIVFWRLSRTGTICFRNHVTVDGTIEPLSHFNCSYVLNASRDKLTLFYRDQAGKDRSGMVKRTGKFLIFSAVLKNAFVQKTEFWDLIPLHYCKDYNLQVTLPAGAILKNAGVYKVDATGKETELENIPVIKMRQDSRDKIIVSIADYFYTETFRVRWEIF